MKARWWILIILVAWLLLDPRGFAGCWHTFFSSLGTFRDTFNH